MSDLTWTPVKVKLSILDLWLDNPKLLTQAEAKKLTKSDKILGRAGALLVGPIQPDGHRPLYDGHQRTIIWRVLYGLDVEIWALESNRNLTDEERRAVSINTITATGSFDWDKLSAWEQPELVEWGLDQDWLRGLNNDANNVREMLVTEIAIDDAFGKLPDEDRVPFQQMTFTLHDNQAEQVREALKLSQSLGDFTDTGNENSNGNALARICETYITDYDNG